jgi:chemotaxis protein histidine kinase CheA
VEKPDRRAIVDANVELDDELLGEFINEAREHLTTIETDLLAIEEGGANIDAELRLHRATEKIRRLPSLQTGRLFSIATCF